ncbi:protein TonB [Sulfitobacter marinus]|uniref:Protein TonB n=1 Tax=Sulfitobacter marinus TaxID=394264 RepID=A0A1I6UBE7_9RHOB|nr:energy transducer TonB [Sulfitobacter marinus]SFS98745.1 protein TonB [Sulfitobacter marinus]
MIRVVINSALFLLIAFGLHVAAFWAKPSDGASASAGAGGSELMTLVAAPESYGDLIKAWETPPDIAEASVELTAPEPVLADLVAPDLEATAATPIALPQMLQSPSVLDDVPVVQVAPPPPTPPVHPLSKIKPPQRPKPPVKKPAKPAPVKKQPAQATSTPSKAATAAGTGGTSNAGNRQTSAHSNLSKSEKQSLVAAWGASIRAKIDRAKRRPRGGKTGVVTVVVSVSHNGALVNVGVSRSSGQPALDAAAVAGVKRARRFSKAPKQLAKTNYTFRLKIEFTSS